MIKLANKIALASLLGTEAGMEKMAKFPWKSLYTGLGGLAGGLAGSSSSEDKPVLSGLLGVATGALAGRKMPGVLYSAIKSPVFKLAEAVDNTKNEKARKVLYHLFARSLEATLLGFATAPSAAIGYGIGKTL